MRYQKLLFFLAGLFQIKSEVIVIVIDLFHILLRLPEKHFFAVSIILYAFECFPEGGRSCRNSDIKVGADLRSLTVVIFRTAGNQADFAFLNFRHHLHDCQAQSGPAGGSCTGLIDTEECLEDFFRRRLWNSFSLILHLDRYRIFMRLNKHPDICVLSRILQRIVDEVSHHLFHHASASEYRRHGSR